MFLYFFNFCCSFFDDIIEPTAKTPEDVINETISTKMKNAGFL
jgi:hypothetical protein